MACYHPIPAYQGGPGEPVKLWPHVGTANLNLPCGNCLGCRTDLATDWAHRAQLELTNWKHNCFLTLTYDDTHLPEGGHLRPRDLQKFIKRLRRGLDRQDTAILSDPGGIRYLASGEYGETTLRPHFHLLLFNCNFADKHRVAKNLEESPALMKYWKKGAHRIGELTGASANYVAQYSLKKLKASPDGVRHDAYGEIYKQPFMRMSLKPPIGKAWVDKHKNDLQHGYLVRDARKKRIPRGTIKQLKQVDPLLAEQAQHRASQHARTKHDLRAAEIIHESKNALFHNRHL